MSDVCDECGCEKFSDRPCPECSDPESEHDAPPFNERVQGLLAKIADPRDAEIADLRERLARAEAESRRSKDLLDGLETHCHAATDLRDAYFARALEAEARCQRAEAKVLPACDVATIRHGLQASVNRLRNGTRKRHIKDNRNLFAVEGALAFLDEHYPEASDV